MQPVRALQLAVAEMDGRWSVLVNGRQVGWFDRRPDAERCLLDMAGQTRCDGYPVQVTTPWPLAEGRSIRPERSRP